MRGPSSFNAPAPPAPVASPSAQPAQAPRSLSEELSALAQLHVGGVVDTDEFRAFKLNLFHAPAA